VSVEVADPRQLRRWSEDVARDPRSLSFLPLAHAYQRLGRAEAALRLCLRGLQYHPENVQAHFLLGTLYRAAGDLEKAQDEWDIAVRLNPGHAAAHQELGLLCFERGQITAARHHLERASASESAGSEIARALARLRHSANVGASEAAEAGEAPRAAAAAVTDLLQAVRQPIERFAGAAQPSLMLLITSQGKLLGHHGFSQNLDPVGIASLTAGIHASSQALAGMLGQARFDHLYQRGSRGQIFIGPFAVPGEELIVVVVLKDESRLGLVRIAFANFVAEVAALPEWRQARRTVTAESFEHELASGFVELFGGNR
jgi:tetratricopeptide (TPR) repeat protein